MFWTHLAPEQRCKPLGALCDRKRRKWIEHMSRKTEALQYDYSVRRADFVEQQGIDAAVEQELRTQLRESQAREEALKAAIALLRPS